MPRPPLKKNGDQRARCDRDWRRYASATGATLAMATSADAAVQHTQPPTPISIMLANQSNGSEMVGLDVDDDDLMDFDFYVAASTSMSSPGYTSLFRSAGVSAARSGAAILGTSSQAQRLLLDSVVSAGVFSAAQLSAGFLRQSTFSNPTTSAPLFEAGSWGESSAGYLGVKFTKSAQDHFGWIKVATTANTSGLVGLTLLEWAYEDIPGGGILAGDKVGQLPTLPGDYDRSGTVDAQDYAIWKNTFGSSVVPGSGADGNVDAIVNAADYPIWRNNLSVGGVGYTASLPEADTIRLGILALGAMGVAALRRN